ncbi:MAG: HAMP domain-containing methyl-accepting chemotaxis protein [Clostridia bacterium]
MEHLTKGDLHYKFDFESDDEIGELAEDFRKTSVELSIYIDEITKQLRSFGDGDFTYESDVEFIGDFGNIQIALAQFKSLMSKTLGNLTTTIEEVSLGAMQVAHGSQSLAQGAEEQTGEIDNLAQTVDLITKTVKDNAENANEANNLGSSVTVILKESTDYMVELSEAISQIQTSSTDIEKIIKTIDDIAFQTNILALNAAVEASRAGEAGKGFAVVADEVRNLAQKSTEAANGTTSLIQNSLDAVQKGVKIAQETNQSFAKVDESSKKVLDLISKISIASTEQANSINEISVGLNQISTVVQQNSAISEENAAVAEELSSQSTVMTNSVQAFKISKNDNQF